VALVSVLLAIVLLTVFLTEVQQESSAAFAAAVADRDRLRAEYLAKSAINLARLLVATEPTVRRVVSPLLLLLNPKGGVPQIPVWEFSDQVLGPFNDAAGAEGFSALAAVDTATGENLGLGGEGRFELVIIDEESKLNINTAARGDIISRTRVAQQLMGLLAPPQYNPMFENEDADGQHSDRQTICGAIIDWADSDEELESCDLSAQAPTARGVEDNYYQTIGLPYFRKNAAYDSLEELRLVRGVGDDFWATFVDPDPRDPRKRVMTVWGSGAVNVNTANAQTLLALVCAGAPDAEMCLDPLQAAAFLQVVTLVRGFTAGAPLFGSPADFVNTMKGAGIVGPLLASQGIKPVKFRSEAEMRKMVSTESKLFSIYAVGVVPGRQRETRVSVHAVVDFRSAAAPAAVGGVTSTGTPVASPDGTDGSAGSEAGTLDPAALAQALARNPAGNVVYWRLQ
jgi:general secretion pathway protein K